MKRILSLLLISTAAVLFIHTPKAHAVGPFYYMGDGKIVIGRGKGNLKQITFREKDGTYNGEGLRKINSIYGTDWDEEEQRMSLRLIELLDYLEDYFGGRGLQIVSGYRSPAHNEGLRKGGKLAASSSLHIDAEAIDVVMNGVPSSKINNFLIPQNCCGVGYYHGKAIHIDTGPPRFWDEKTSGTEKKEPPENEHITIKTKSDVYGAGDRIGVKFSRVTDYPIGIEKEMKIVCKQRKFSVKPQFEPTVKSADKGCYILKNRKEGRSILAPTGGVKSREKTLQCRIRADFCGPKTARMPEYVDSNEFLLTF